MAVTAAGIERKEGVKKSGVAISIAALAAAFDRPARATYERDHLLESNGVDIDGLEGSDPLILERRQEPGAQVGIQEGSPLAQITVVGRYLDSVLGHGRLVSLARPQDEADA